MGYDFHIARTQNPRLARFDRHEIVTDP